MSTPVPLTFLSPLRVSDYLRDTSSLEIAKVNAKESVVHALELLKDNEIAALFVKGKNGSIVGGVDLFDISNLKLNKHNICGSNIQELMGGNRKGEWHIVGPNEKIEKVLQLLCSSRKVWVKEGGKTMGMITRGGLVDWIYNKGKRYGFTMLFEEERLRAWQRKEVISVQEDSTINEAINKITSNHISGLPVVDNRGILRGHFNITDFKFLEGDESNFEQKLETFIQASQSFTPTVEENSRLGEALNIIINYQVERVYILDKLKRVKTVISLGDIINHISSNLKKQQEIVRLRQHYQFIRSLSDRNDRTVKSQ